MMNVFQQLIKTNFKKDQVTEKTIAKQYQSLPSLHDQLPWRDYHEKTQTFLLEDLQSLGVAFEIVPLSCEARPQKTLEHIANAFKDSLRNAIPFEKEDPWVLQTFVEKIPNLNEEKKRIADYFQSQGKPSSLQTDYLTILNEHLDYLSQPEGIFQDEAVTGLPFRGGRMIVRAVLYRRRTKRLSVTEKEKSLKDIHLVAKKCIRQWKLTGLKVKRMSYESFHAWMFKWFNPAPKSTQGNVDALLSCIQHPDLQYADVSEQLFFNAPESFDGGWFFDDMPHRLMTIEHLTREPEIGHITSERKNALNDRVFNLMDHLPLGSIFVMNVVFQSKSQTEWHLKQVEKSAIGRHALAESVRAQVNLAEREIAHGNYYLPLSMGIYLKAETIELLEEKTMDAEGLLESHGFKVILDTDIFPMNAYLKFLPMNYAHAFDVKYGFRSRYVALSDIAKLLPFYGRSRGTDHFGMVFFNRGGETLSYDVMRDKTKNGHLLFLGESGTGKSNTLNQLVIHDLALSKPIFVVTEVGGSFEMSAKYAAFHGLSVNYIKINLAKPISLNPFIDAIRVLDQISEMDFNSEKKADELIKEKEDNAVLDASTLEESDDAPRDILGEMVIAALIMITGGEKKEEERISRSDRMMIIDAIIDAAKSVKACGKTQVIASDIVSAFEAMQNKAELKRDPDKIKRIREMADGMRYFTKDPVSSTFFNSYSEPLELGDLNVIDFGIFGNEGYESHRALAYCGLASKILAFAEINQYTNRPIKWVHDEDHLFLNIPLLADRQTRVSKMGRKLGLWLWIATQNMQDFADNSRRLLSQIETWICLALPLDEIHQVERFKPLTDEERALFLSARKEKHKYTEGILMSPTLKCLFRAIPPRLFLTMAATDQDEKAHRMQVIQDNQCSELEAVRIIANNLMNKKVDHHDE